MLPGGRDAARPRFDPQLLAALGITRLADQTGLDTIGIPVWSAIRPASRVLSVSQGKGLTTQQATISAVMEAAEGALAERHEVLISLRVPAAELAPGEVVPLNRLLRCAQHDPAIRRGWVRGTALRSGGACYAPYELVGFDMCADVDWDRDSFHMSSMGLAAHFDRQAAIVHALLELIEIDATALLDMFGYSYALAPPITFEPPWPDPLATLLDRVHAAGCEVVFTQLPSQVSLPVIGCFLGWQTVGRHGAGMGWSSGFACRAGIVDAACAALLEAIQARLTTIVGAREDLPDARLAPSTLGARLQRTEARTIPSALQVAPQATLATILAALEQAEIPEVFVFDLGGNELGLSAVRVLVPDLQVPAHGGAVRLGPTAWRRLLVPVPS